jgi:mono/diheme cytochrome c family protein
MKSRAAFILLASLSAAGLLMAQKIRLVEPVRTGAANGKEMFVNYCSPCHGLDGRGDGPACTSRKFGSG